MLPQEAAVAVAMACWCRGLVTILALVLRPTSAAEDGDAFKEGDFKDGDTFKEDAVVAAVIREHIKIGAQSLAIVYNGKMEPFFTEDTSTYNIMIEEELGEGLMSKVGRHSQHYMIVVEELGSAEEFLDVHGKHMKKKGAFYSIVARSATLREMERAFKQIVNFLDGFLNAGNRNETRELSQMCHKCHRSSGRIRTLRRNCMHYSVFLAWSKYLHINEFLCKLLGNSNCVGADIWPRYFCTWLVH